MTDWAWHVHHNRLCEPLRESMKTRRAYIRTEKPANEIETRLRLLKGVRGEMPAKLIDAFEAAGKAAESAAWKAAESAAWLAWLAYEKAYEDAMPEINRMHLEECPDCPWDGKTIFPRGMITALIDGNANAL